MLSLFLNNDGLSLYEIVTFVIGALITIFLAMPVHEYAHARIAVALGDGTPRHFGRLSLNPLNHIDWVGAASILFFGIGWAKPVGINARNFKSPKWGMALVAFAGPITNLLMALASLLLYNTFMVIAFYSDLVALWFVAEIFVRVASINITLAVFNLIPIPPLDGSKFLGAFLPDRIYYNLMRYEQYFSFVLLLLIFSNVLDTPLFYATYYVGGFLDSIAILPFKLFGLI